MRPAWPPGSGMGSRLCARTGSRTRAGSHRWTRPPGTRPTGTGRRPSLAPSTGWSDLWRTGPGAFEHSARCDDSRVPTKITTDVLVIGGGATGAGVAWDAALRGLDVVLSGRRDLAEGTSGRFRGLLHSGGRYAVKDPRAAEECIGENRILRRVAADCIEDTGGFFVTTPWDDPAYADRFAAGCRDTGIDCEEIDPAVALAQEARLNPD